MLLYLLLGIIILLVVSCLYNGIYIVPQGYQYIVQRLGKYHVTLKAGVNFIIPFIDTVNYKVTTKDIVLDIPSQEVISKDNVVIIMNAVAFINIQVPEKAVYGVDNYQFAIQNLIQTALRSIVGEMDLDSALSSRENIKAKLKATLSKEIEDWGIMVKTVEIQDITPSETMVKSMENQASAERLRRASVSEAEGKKAAAILEAEGKLEASKKEAEAQIVLAEASKQSIQLITQAVGDKTMPVAYLLGEQYIKSMQEMATSSNSKTIVLPADILNTVKGLLDK